MRGELAEVIMALLVPTGEVVVAGPTVRGVMVDNRPGAKAVEGERRTGALQALMLAADHLVELEARIETA